MSRLAVDNIITVSNLFEIVEMTKKKVGYEYQAPVDEATQLEITSKTIRRQIQELVEND